MKYLTGSIFAALAICVFFAGCRKGGGAGADFGWDEGQFTEAIARLDRAIGLCDKAINEKLPDLQKTLIELEQSLKSDTQDLMGKEVRIIIADLKNLPIEMFDYFEVKLKDNLKAMRKALAQARKDIVDAKKKKDESGIQLALDKLANIKVFHDPVVTGFIPSNINIEWKDHTQADYTIRIPLIEIRGWGFERPAGEELKMAVAIEGADGELRLLPSAVLFLTSRYVKQIKLDTAGVEILKGDHRLVLIINTDQPSDRREVPISHKIPPVSEEKKVEPPPLPPPTRGVLFDSGDRITFKVESTGKPGETTIALNRTNNVSGFWKAIELKVDGREAGKIEIKDNDRQKEMTVLAGTLNGKLRLYFGKHGAFPLPGAWRGITELPITKEELLGKRITYTWERD